MEIQRYEDREFYFPEENEYPIERSLPYQVNIVHNHYYEQEKIAKPVSGFDSVFETRRSIEYQIAAEKSSVMAYVIIIFGSLVLASFLAFIGTVLEYQHRERIILYQNSR